MKKIYVTVITMIVIFILGGCGYGDLELVNTLEFDNGNYVSISLDYDADDIKIIKGKENRVIVKEYMNKDKDKYYAKDKTDGRNIRITEGKRPLSSGFKGSIELHKPVSYDGDLKVHSTSGIVDLSDDLAHLGSCKLDTTSGEINVSNANLNNLNLKSTSGEIVGDDLSVQNLLIENTSSDVHLNNMNGFITYKSKSGSLKAENLEGGGQFEATGDGDLFLSFNRVDKDIKMFSKNETIQLSLPQSLSFEYGIRSKEGDIRTFFNTDEDVLNGSIGNSPLVNVDLETRNGDINILTNKN